MRKNIHRVKIKEERWHPCMCKECQAKIKAHARCRQSFYGFLSKLAPKLLKVKCSICKSPFYVIAHHENYNKPLQVLWVCISCHRRIHENKLTFPRNLIIDYEKYEI